MSKSAPPSSGKTAEDLAETFLLSKEFKIVTRNFRTRWYEIDIVAEKGKTIHFVEVKYRKSSFYGSGYDYVTPSKQTRLKRAAEMWMSSFNPGGDYQIDVLSVVGNLENPSVQYITNAVNDY